MTQCARYARAILSSEHPTVAIGLAREAIILWRLTRPRFHTTDDFCDWPLNAAAEEAAVGKLAEVNKHGEISAVGKVHERGGGAGERAAMTSNVGGCAASARFLLERPAVAVVGRDFGLVTGRENIGTASEHLADRFCGKQIAAAPRA